MAKKTKKQKQRSAARRPGTGAATAPRIPAVGPIGQPPAEPEDTAAPQVGAVARGQPVDAVGAGRRRIERMSPAAAPRQARPGRAPGTAAAMFQPLDSDDAAIPFDRVPYVRSDLRRVAVMAACMVALIIVAAVVVSNVVH